MTTVGCVVLTQGKRKEDLLRAVDSILAQRDVKVDVVVVGNGGTPTQLPDGVQVHLLAENLGVPAGRNAGIDDVTGDLVLFLDDDAHLRGTDFLARAAEMFQEDPRLGIVQPRVIDPDGHRSPRRYVPRLRVGDDTRSSDIVALWEGTVVARREALDRAGPWPAEFGFMHEGIDLTWRVIDAGYSVRYRGDLETYHPAVPLEEHADLRRIGARNRVWLARRNLPAVLGVVYVCVWLGIDLLRARSLHNARQLLRGYRDGLRMPCGRRRPISWRTVARMTRAGRPPVI